MSFASELIFPTEPRRLPGHRAIKIALRGLHTLAAGVFCGAWLFEVPAESRELVLALVIASGMSMLLIDLYESGAFLLQVRGFVLIGKLVTLALLPLYGGWTGIVFSALFVIAVISSHAPSKVRYFVLVGRGKIHGATSKG
jgi:hypothetical protein